MISMSIGALAQHLTQAQLHGPDGTIVRGLTHDSRMVKPGDLFVCLEGVNHDGHRFLSDAFHAGAAGAVVRRGALEKLGVSLPEEISWIEVEDTRRELPRIASTLYGNPSQSMLMVGVTGTNGKTTTTLMTAAILRAAGRRVGTIGTLGAELDGVSLPSEHTTPEADQLQSLLAEMLQRGADAVVMEVSSHALAQFRTDDIAFNAGIFTNITQDHLDFHQTMKAYFEAKARLFTDYPVLYKRDDKKEFIAVINVGQWEGREMVTLARGDVITYTPETSDPAVLRPEEIELAPGSTRFQAVYDSGVKQFRIPIALPVGGAFQVGNALAAIAACLRLGVPPETVQKGLSEMYPVPGRFETVSSDGEGYSVIVDYAHTPDGLENLLHSAQTLHPRRIICLFGCGGNRDKTKRPMMGRLAGTIADIAVVTSDNPRFEDPLMIINEVLAGMDSEIDPSITAEIIVEPDRRKAIFKAVALAQEGDIVLLAGKGHEDYQIIGDTQFPLDDRLIAREAIAERKALN